MDDEPGIPQLTNIYSWPFLTSVYAAPILWHLILPTRDIPLQHTVPQVARPKLRWLDLSSVEIMGINLADPNFDDFEIPEFDPGWLADIVKAVWRFISLIGIFVLVAGLGIAAPILIAVDLFLASEGTIDCGDHCFYIGGSPYSAIGFFTAVLLISFALVVLGMIFYTCFLMLRRDERRRLFG